jgi:hypothetical protein
MLTKRHVITLNDDVFNYVIQREFRSIFDILEIRKYQKSV